MKSNRQHKVVEVAKWFMSGDKLGFENALSGPEGFVALEQLGCQ